MPAVTNLPLRTLRLLDDVALPHAAAWALEEDNEEPVASAPDPGDGGWTRSGSPRLWFAVPADGSLSSLLSLLTEEDCRQILRLQNDMDRWSVAAARAMLRIQLGRYLDCRPQDIALIRTERGKPVLDPRRHGTAATHLHFSVSHRPELVAVAIAHSRVGVDVEAIRTLPELMQVARMQFAPEMLHALEAAGTNAKRTALFYRFWTLGEAFIKATGEGVTQGLKSFAFSADGAPVLTHVSYPWGPRDRWRFGTIGR